MGGYAHFKAGKNLRKSCRVGQPKTSGRPHCRCLSPKISRSFFVRSLDAAFRKTSLEMFKRGPMWLQ